MSRLLPALIVDVSEWFVDEAWRQHVGVRHWRRLPNRAAIALRLVAEELQARGVTATLCVPAQLAMAADPHERQLLVELRERGHDLALSVRTERRLHEIVDADERQALRRSWAAQRGILEAVLGSGVHGFAAAWSVERGRGAWGDRGPWWWSVLRDLGFAYDATPVREREHTAYGLDGREVPVRRFQAWHLDSEQPRLMGLPAPTRELHERWFVDAGERLVRACGEEVTTMADALELPAIEPHELPQDDVDDVSATRVTVATEVPRLAVVVPLKDEADGVVSLFDELDAVANGLADVAHCEFVVVDDGSTDATWSLLEQLARRAPRVRLVRHEHNRGVAAAIRTGLHATDAELVASIDGDLSYDPMELRSMLARLDEGDAHIVTASPYHPDGHVQNVPPWRLFLSRSLSRAYRLLLRSRIHTWTSCFRLYRRASVAELPLQNGGFLGTAELLVRTLRRGGRVVEHPCTLEARLIGFSKMRVVGTVFDHLKLLVLVALRVVR